MKKLIPILALSFTQCATYSDKPNIIIIVADDLGYGDLGAYGCPDMKTPNIDRLAAEGVKFTSFYANAPECTPTRVALLTGRYQQRVGGMECALGAGNVGRYDEAVWLSEQKELGLPPDYSILSKELKQAGFNTAHIGKWHLGYEEKFRANHHFFDYSIGPIGYGGDYFYHTEQDPLNLDDFTGAHSMAINGKEAFREGKYATHLYTEEAVRWISQQNKKDPFFLYLPYTAPHDPYQGPDDDIGRPLSGDEWHKNRNRETYIEMVVEMDKGIGEILDLLEEKELDKNTIVVYFSDNGGTGVANNGIFSGFKGQLLEGGIRVPCIIRWPGKINPNIVSEQVTIGFDITYSSLLYAGIDTDRMELDGYDIMGHIINQKKNFERTLFWRAKRGGRVRKAIRDGDMKYHIEYVGGNMDIQKLTNLAEDPKEEINLLDSMPDIARTLHDKILKWEEEVEAPRLEGFSK